VQWFQSVDGAAHAVDLLENNDFYHRNLDGQLEFPWTGAGMQPYTTLGQVLPGPPGLGPGAFFAKGSASTADGSEASPQGQVTFSNPPSSETIVGATNSPQHFSWVDLHYSRTIPAGGSVPLGFSYSSGYSAAQAAADATAAEAVFRPTVTIVSPQSGIDTAQRTVTVAGAAADVTGLTGVTVNGQPAAVGAGGIWSAPVGLAPGLNTITVVATNVFGNTAQAQSAVVYVPPPAFYALHQAHRRWREGGRRGRHRPPVGTAFTWTLNEPAELRFVFTAQVPGRPGAGGACVAANRRNRHHRRCLRTITVGAHSLSAGGGAGRWRFGGVMAGGRRLGPGTYTVTIVATTPATGVQSAPARLRFTIVH
jgi:hypothetical protein